jgi:hypothetical protein
MVYLIKQEARTGSYFKIGYTKNLARFNAYITNNANVKILETVDTYKKTKHQLETAIHNELKAQGFDFVRNYGIMTEWVFIDIAQEEAFECKGLAQFKACKNRKIIKWAKP